MALARVQRSDSVHARPLAVVQSFRVIRSTTNPYLSQLVDAMPTDVEILPFSWPRAVFGRYDVLHVHWPEHLLRGKPGIRVIARHTLFLMLLVRIRLTRIALVRTLHNVEAYETGPVIERWLLDRCDRETSLWIRLNPRSPLPYDAESRTIVLGDYRDWFRAHQRTPAVSGRFLIFGLIRPYKGVEGLMEAFAKVNDPSLSLRVVGKPNSAELAREVTRLASLDTRIGASLDYVDDETLAAEIGAAELVVLPYRAMHNSSALLLALSLERPVLVPANEITTALMAEVGSAWVHTFEGDLTSATIEEARDWLGSRHPDRAPDLSGREWTTIGLQHLDAYRAAVTTQHYTRRGSEQS